MGPFIIIENRLFSSEMNSNVVILFSCWLFAIIVLLENRDFFLIASY